STAPGSTIAAPSARSHARAAWSCDHLLWGLRPRTRDGFGRVENRRAPQATHSPKPSCRAVRRPVGAGPGAWPLTNSGPASNGRPGRRGGELARRPDADWLRAGDRRLGRARDGAVAVRAPGFLVQLRHVRDRRVDVADAVHPRERRQRL